MTDRVGFELSQALRQHGPSLLADAARLEGVVRDRLGDAPREIFLVMAAYRDGIHESFGGHRETESLVDRLVHRFAFDRDAARWTVAVWAQVLEREAAKVCAAPVLQAKQTIRVGFTRAAQCATIGQALRQASPMCRIVIEPGHYLERLQINEPLTLEAAGPRSEVVVENQSSHTLGITAGPVVIRGLTFRRIGDRPGHEGAGICVLGGAVHIEDCDIVSGSLSNVFLQGEKSSATILNCDLHHGQECGVLVREGAYLHIAESRIFRNRLSGIHGDQGRIHLSRCQIFDQEAAHGMTASNRCECTVEDCDFSGNGLAAVHGERSRLTLHRTVLSNGHGAGIIAYASSAILDECRVQANAKSGVFVSSESTMLARDSSFSQHPEHGVLVAERSQIEMVQCDIGQNGMAGICLRDNCRVSLSRCTIHDHASNNGVTVADDSSLVMSECQVTENGHAAVELSSRSRAHVSRCRFDKNRTYGVRACDHSTGTIEACHVEENEIAAVSADPSCNIQHQ